MKMPNNTVSSALAYFKDELKSFFDASEITSMIYIVFEYYFGLSKTDLILNAEKQLSESELLKVIFTVKDLKNKKPLAYILGEWEFFGLRFKVNEHTLIPRPETEELVDLILKENTGNLTVLDIGTGSGCIPITLKKNNINLTVFGCDVSEEALLIASKNAKSNNVAIELLEYDILKNKNNKFKKPLDVIVSNPPYIPTKEKQLMNDNVLNYEPHLALFVEDKSPILFYDAISDFALVNLKAEGKLYFEINENYGVEVKELLEQKGFKNVNIVKDINDKDRIVSCKL